MSIPFRSQRTTVSSLFRQVAAELPDEPVTIERLLAMVGEQGLLSVCILATVPFLLPISIPGTSVPFGLIVILIGVGIALKRVPWMPQFVLRRSLPGRRMAAVLESAARLFVRIERWVHPRWTWVVDGGPAQRMNGLALVASGFLLLLPIPIPGTNTPPAWATLLLAMALLERDGIFAIAGYVVMLLTIALFTALAVAAWTFGTEALSWLPWT